MSGILFGRVLLFGIAARIERRRGETGFTLNEIPEMFPFGP
jgi:hypothetical protein